MTSQNTRGAALMAGAMVLFTGEDLFLRAAAQSMPVGQAMLLFGALGMGFFMLMARVQGGRILHPQMLSRPLVLRGIAEISGRAGYSVALALIPFAMVSSILQATPLLVVAGAALIFGERVRLSRWLAILAGFAGVLIILRPGLDGFTPAALFALIGMAGFAGRDLATRAAPAVLTTAQLGVAGFFNLIPAGLIVLAVQGAPVALTAMGLAMCLGAALFGVVAYSALTKAMRTGEVGVVTPFRYIRLPVSLLASALWLGEAPDLFVYLGSGLILLAGLYTLVTSRG